MHTSLHKSLSILFFSLSTIILLSVVPPAYAGTLQPDNFPDVPDALVNYDSVNNESTITWDFSALPNYTGGSEDGKPAKCAIKADFGFSSDPVFNPSVMINGFIAREYSPLFDPPVSLTGGPLQSTDNPDTDIQGREIPCTGELIIKFDQIMGVSYDHDDPNNATFNHVNNTATHVGVEPFISFYIMNSNGDFVTDDSKVVDEVLIMYHPTAIEIDQHTIDWACGANDFTDVNPEDGIDDNQIAVGNVLFIDQSGIRGTGGPYNCDTVQELDNEEFCCDFTVSITASDSGGCSDCIDPTFYYSQNRIIVQDGFRYNAYSTNVTGNLHTGIPLLFTYTNQTNFLTLKVYDNFGTSAIKWIDVGFGSSGQYTPLDQAEVRFETKFSDNSIVQSWVYPKDQNLIDFRNATSSIVDCGYFGTLNCLQITIPHTFRDELEYPGIVIYAEDNSENNKSHYLNDGIEILGESLNESPTDRVFIQKYLGNPEYEWVTIDRIDRVDDIWSSQDGMEFKGTSGGGFQRITPLGFDNTLID